jgi:hypothetical protein
MVEHMYGTDVEYDSEATVLVGVPANLEDIPPGYVLAAVLDDIDINTCSGFDRVRVLKAQERMRSHYAARSYLTMTKVLDAIDEDDMAADMVEQAAASEVAAALRLTRHAADIEMTLALQLHRRLPRVWDALLEGTIDVRRARVLVDGTLHLSIGAAQEIIAGVVDDAARMTTGQLSAKLRKLCIQQDPGDATDRYQHAVDDRRVVTQPTVDGTTDLYALNLPPHRTQAAMRRINRLAQALKHNGDPRSIDQIRADVLLDLLEGTGTLNDDRAGVVIATDLPTLTKLADHPGELAGYGPVIADIARQIVHNQHNTQWRWTLVDPDSGQPIDGGTTRRRPTTAQRRKTEILHPTCVHPGCRMPAFECDLDHRIPHTQTRTTCTDDLAPLCRHHHMLKHHAGWEYTPQPNGDHLFVSPLRHKYTTSGRDP